MSKVKRQLLSYHSACPYRKYGKYSCSGKSWPNMESQSLRILGFILNCDGFQGVTSRITTPWTMAVNLYLGPRRWENCPLDELQAGLEGRL
ncbi:matrix Gla protein isoform X2 [Numida meleagris]|uniref:matrix Gla protein isoform X2 n=1 Tax=Numida meleagris TaxID=8996 RepID=UPI000B3DD806|nr:matrix Gla protein isoform X2 [Numida meleagris]XP_021271558.1 matrix Gla protein isoform X2 [Numida meleagris]